MDSADGIDNSLSARRPGTGRHLILVTGMSGAGRSTALAILEDLGYEAVDNLPLTLLTPLAFAEGISEDLARPIAVGIDIRTRHFGVQPLLRLIDRLEENSTTDVRVLFIDCDDEVLRRRFTETRRRHPLAADRPVTDGIRLERQIVTALRDRADLVVDTSTMRPQDFKQLMHGQFTLDQPSLALSVMSFSFRRGLPREADLVFDVRFLSNPHYDPQLRPFTGLDAAVGAFVAADPGFEGFFGGLTGWLGPLIPRYRGEGKSYLTIAVGCTGGRHRSVYVAERLTQWLVGQGTPVSCTHRDLDAADQSSHSRAETDPDPGDPESDDQAAPGPLARSTAETS